MYINVFLAGGVLGILAGSILLTLGYFTVGFVVLVLAIVLRQEAMIQELRIRADQQDAGRE
jgi:hypothetical protein